MVRITFDVLISQNDRGCTVMYITFFYFCFYHGFIMRRHGTEKNLKRNPWKEFIFNWKGFTPSEK